MLSTYTPIKPNYQSAAKFAIVKVQSPIHLVHRSYSYGHRLSKIDFETEVGHVLRRHRTQIGEMTQIKGHYAVQGHSRSPILVPIENSYTTSY